MARSDVTPTGQARRGAALRFIREAVRVRGDACIVTPYGLRQNEYAQLLYRGKTMNAHRVAYFEAYGDLPKGLDICHNCGVRACVNPAHLRADTRLSNVQDTEIHGTRTRGSMVGRGGLTEDQAIEVSRSDEPLAVLADRFGVSDAAIRDVRRGRCWGWLTGRERAVVRTDENRHAVKLTADIARAIYADPSRCMDAAEKFGVSRPVVSNIRHGVTWAHVTGHAKKAVKRQR